MKELVKEYGGGLYELAADEGIEELLLSETRVLRSVLTAEYLHLLVTPGIPKAERTALIGAATEGKAHPYVVNFMKILTERGSAGDIPDCFEEYERLYFERHGMIKAVAETAVEMTDVQIAALKKKLEAHTGKIVELECKIDKSLLGGVRLSFDNRLLDASAKAKLREISDSLAVIVM